MKKQEIVTTNSTSMVPQIFNQQEVISVDDLVAEQDARSAGQFLPYIYFTNESNCPQEIPKRQLWIKEGRTTREVATPYVISYIGMRPTIRTLLPTKRYGKRLYQSYPGFDGKTAVEFESNFAKYKDSRNYGVTFILYLMENADSKDRKVSIVTFEGFASLSSYLSKPLSEGKAVDGKGAYISLRSHESNLVSNDNGSYLSSGKFTQYTVINLSKEDAVNFQQAFADQEKQVENFLTQ